MRLALALSVPPEGFINMLFLRKLYSHGVTANRSNARSFARFQAPGWKWYCDFLSSRSRTVYDQSGTGQMRFIRS